MPTPQTVLIYTVQQGRGMRTWRETLCDICMLSHHKQKISGGIIRLRPSARRGNLFFLPKTNKLATSKSHAIKTMYFREHRNKSLLCVVDLTAAYF